MSKNMTQAEFLKELKKITNLKWQTIYGAIRAKFNRRVYCPLTAVLFNKTNKYVTTNKLSYEQLEKINIGKKLADMVVKEADRPGYSTNFSKKMLKILIGVPW